MVTDKKNDVKIDWGKSKNGLLMMRAFGTIEFNNLDVWRCINYNPWRPEWDKNADEIYFMKKVGIGAYHMYSRTKKIYVVAPREYLLDLFTFQEKDGTIIIIISSNDSLEKDLPDFKKGIIRANVPIGGWIFRPDPENPQRT